jgi:hypothetical protein
MTVLLVLLFLIIMLGMDALVQRRRARQARRSGANVIIRHLNGTVQEIFEHGDGICPTMADGGQKVK